jgi:adenylate kinase
VRLVLVGPPGAGKGTQAQFIAQHLGVPQISTGDIFRANVSQGTPLGLEAKAYMDRGDLVPDSVILGIMRDELAKPDYAKGVVLDGVVRTVPQAEGMRDVLVSLGRKLDAVVSLDIPNDEIVKRMSMRTVCGSCQTPFTGREVGDKCDNCGGVLQRRKDDEPEAVRNRLKVYEAQTAPVRDWYKHDGVKLAEVDAVGSVDDVTSRVMRALGR